MTALQTIAVGAVLVALCVLAWILAVIADARRSSGRHADAGRNWRRRNGYTPGHSRDLEDTMPIWAGGR